MRVNRRGFIGGMVGLVGAVLASPVLESAPASGSASLPVGDQIVPVTVTEQGGVAFEVGDVFQIAGQYAVHPVTKRVLGPNGGQGVLQQFVVTARTTADELAASPAPAMFPKLIGAGASQNVYPGGRFKAVDVRPLMYGAQGLAFQSNAFAMVVR